MKQMKCPECEATFQAETAQEMMMGDMMTHYKEEHAEMMAAMGEKSEEEQAAAKKEWMDTFTADFEAAEEI